MIIQLIPLNNQQGQPAIGFMKGDQLLFAELLRLDVLDRRSLVEKIKLLCDEGVVLEPHPAVNGFCTADGFEYLDV